MNTHEMFIICKVLLIWLDDVLKQIVTRRSLKEQEAKKHKNTRTQEHKYFPWGNHKGENPAKIPPYRSQPDQCKTQRTASNSFLTH